MFRLKKWDGRQAQRARHRFVHVISSALSPEQVFDVVASAEFEAEWFPDFVSAEWETPAPHGPGSIRAYKLTYMRITEEFLVWDRGTRLLFRLNECSLPILAAFMESYVLTRRAGGGTDLCWEVSYEPNPWLAFLHPLVQPWFAADFAKAARQLEDLLQRLAVSSVLGVRQRGQPARGAGAGVAAWT